MEVRTRKFVQIWKFLYEQVSFNAKSLQRRIQEFDSLVSQVVGLVWLRLF